MSYEFDYEKYQKEQVEKAGFKPDELSQIQMDLVLQPSEAPENFHCDGEITPKQAFAFWCQRMFNSGLTQAQINKAITYNFG